MTCGKVWHYRAEGKRDPIPRIDQSGMRIAMDTIITLKSHARAEWHDHGFNSKTYADHIKRHYNNFTTTGNL